MIELQVLSELTPLSYESAAELWSLTGVGNSARGDTFDAVAHTLANGGRLILLLLDSVPVGTVWLTHDYRRLYLHHMSVHPDYQGHGYGKQLLEAALNYAREIGLQAKLEVHQHNPAALHLYTSYGFECLDGYQVMVRRKKD